MAKKGRPSKVDYSMQQEIYGRVNYNETPKSAIDKERARIQHEKALKTYRQFAELAGVQYTWGINRDISNYLKEYIL